MTDHEEQIALEKAAERIPMFMRANALIYLGLALGMFLASCAAQPNKLAPEPPYIGQRADTSVEITPSGYLRDLEAR